MHFCTRESFFVDAIDMKGICSICGKSTVLKIGWTEIKCPKCERYFNLDDLAGIVKERRKLLGMSRNEMAAIMEIKPSTVKKYESDYPSEKYWNKTFDLIANTPGADPRGIHNTER